MGYILILSFMFALSVSAGSGKRVEKTSHDFVVEGLLQRIAALEAERADLDRPAARRAAPKATSTGKKTKKPKKEKTAKSSDTQSTPVAPPPLQVPSDDERERLEGLQRLYDELQGRMRATEREHAQLLQGRDRMRLELDQMRQNYYDALTMRDRLNSQREEMRAQAQALETQLEQMRLGFADERQVLLAMIAEKEQALIQLQVTLAEGAVQTETPTPISTPTDQGRVAVPEAVDEQTEVKLAQLEEMLVELNTVLSAKDLEIEEHKQALQRKQEQLQELNSDYKDQLQQLQSRANDAEEFEVQNRQLTSSIQDLMGQLQTAQQFAQEKLLFAEQVIDETKRLRQETLAAAHEKTELIREIESSREDLERADKENGALLEAKGRLEVQTESLQKRLDEVELDVAQKSSAINEYEDQILKLKAEVARLHKEVLVLRQDNELKTRRLSEDGHELDLAAAEIFAKSQKLREIEQRKAQEAHLQWGKVQKNLRDVTSLKEEERGMRRSGSLGSLREAAKDMPRAGSAGLLPQKTPWS